MKVFRLQRSWHARPIHSSPVLVNLLSFSSAADGEEVFPRQHGDRNYSAPLMAETLGSP